MLLLLITHFIWKVHLVKGNFLKSYWPQGVNLRRKTSQCGPQILFLTYKIMGKISWVVIFNEASVDFNFTLLSSLKSFLVISGALRPGGVSCVP